MEKSAYIIIVSKHVFFICYVDYVNEWANDEDTNC
jgi:hypothetical protein